MTPKPILRIAAAVVLVTGMAFPAAARPLALDAPMPAAGVSGAEVITPASSREEDLIRWRIWRDWKRGEISASERDRRLKRLERRIHDRQHDRDWGRRDDRRYRGHGHGRRTLPASCIRRLEGGRHDRRVFGAHCLERSGVRTSRLPDRCEGSIRFGGRDRTFFGARCLERAGYRIVGPRHYRDTSGPIYRAPRRDGPYYSVPHGDRSSGSRLVYRNGAFHLLLDR